MNIQSDRPAIIRHIFYIKFIHSSRQTGTQIYRKVFDRRSYDRHFENATTIGYTAMMVTYVMYTHFRLQTKHMWQAWGDWKCSIVTLSHVITLILARHCCHISTCF